MSVAAHYRKKLEKDDLKRLSKEVCSLLSSQVRLLTTSQVAKKLVRGDYKSGRVKDPAAKLSSKHEKTVKTYVKDFLDKAVKKKEEREKSRAARGDGAQDDKDATPNTPQIDLDDAVEATVDANVSPNDSSSELKRKREDEADDSPRNIRSRTDDPPAPPPPPPPPVEDMPMEVDESDLTPMDDGSMGSFTEGTAFNSKVVLQVSGQPSPMQLATPPTNGSGESRSNGSSNLR
jgi:histone-lysine N-methyltransferase SETD2